MKSKNHHLICNLIKGESERNIPQHMAKCGIANETKWIDQIGIQISRLLQLQLKQLQDKIFSPRNQKCEKNNQFSFENDNY